MFSDMLSKLLSPDLREGVIARLKTGGKGYYFFTTLCGLLLMAALATGLHGMLVGFGKVYNTYREVPWGILIATYAFFAITSTGLCLVSAVGHVFGNEDLVPVAKRAIWMSMITISGGFMVMGFEVENPLRMAIYNVLSPNLTSNIWWMGTLYGGFLVVTIFEFTFVLMGKWKIATICGLIGVVTDIAANSNLGAVFGMLNARATWYGPLTPVSFIAAAMTSGCAAVILFTWLAYKVSNSEMDKKMAKAMSVTGRLAMLMICVLVFMTSWRFVVGLSGSDSQIAGLMALISGPYTLNFWVFEVAFALVIPFFLLLSAKGQNLKTMFIASVLMLAGLFVMRYDLVVVGQLVPVYFELGVKEYSHLLEYTPSFHETMVAIGAFAFVGVGFLLGEKVFDGHKMEEHHH